MKANEYLAQAASEMRPCGILDLEKVREAAKSPSSDGIKFSDLVLILAKSSNVSDARARYIVRCALDRGFIRTDSKFLVHEVSPT